MPCVVQSRRRSGIVWICHRAISLNRWHHTVPASFGDYGDPRWSLTFIGGRKMTNQARDDRPRPSFADAERIVRKSEEDLARQLRELEQKLPRSDREMRSTQITI